jgi:hypothetical protein
MGEVKAWPMACKGKDSCGWQWQQALTSSGPQLVRCPRCAKPLRVPKRAWDGVAPPAAPIRPARVNGRSAATAVRQAARVQQQVPADRVIASPRPAVSSPQTQLHQALARFRHPAPAKIPMRADPVPARCRRCGASRDPAYPEICPCGQADWFTWTR